MARGFGATLGAGTTDIITSALTSKPTTRSYHIWTLRNGTGGGNFGRMWDAAGAADLASYDNSFTAYAFTRAWSGGNAAWYFTTIPSTGVWAGVGISYDGGSTVNDPVMYLNGVAQSITELANPGGTLVTTTGAYSIGNRASDSARNWDGSLAELGVWDAILSPAEFAALGKGYSPLLIRPASLVEYVPMVRATLSRKLAAPSITGTAVRPHPRIILPSRLAA